MKLQGSQGGRWHSGASTLPPPPFPHQCNPGSHYGVDNICGLNLWLVLSLIVPRGFSSGLTSGFPLSSKINTSKFQGSRGEGEESKAKNIHSSARLRQVGFGLGRLKLIKHSSNRTSNIYLEQFFFFQLCKIWSR